MQSLLRSYSLSLPIQSTDKEMNHDLKTSCSIDINCDAARVWEVMTQPELIKLYLHGTECITDWQVDSPIVFQGEYEGNTYKDKGIVKERVEHKLLSYRYWSGFSGLADAPENYGLVTYRINSKGDQLTEFTWEQAGYPDEARQTHSSEGMPAFLAHIKQVAEQQ